MRCLHFPRPNRLRAGIFLCAMALLLPELRAQEITGTISGTVTDTSGAVVPGAGVTVLSENTGIARSTTSSSAGIYFFNRLPIGRYSLTVEKAGFAKAERTGLVLNVNDKLNVDVALHVGAVTEKMTVSAAATSLLQTETAEVSNLVGAAQTQMLPLNGRDFNQLVDLMPGVSPDNGKVNSGTGLFSDTNVSVNGSQSNSNMFLLDGQYNLDSGGSTNLLVTPSIDSIEEFKILRNNYSAEFGSATGGIINIVTKSGQRDFHGSAYDFFRNDILNANDPFLNASGQQKSKLRYNNFGFSLGGPFWIPDHYNKDKTRDFFFVSAEWRRETRGKVFSDKVPSDCQSKGFIDPAAPPPPAGTCSAQFEIPVALMMGETNVATASIDLNAAAFLQRYPLPNVDPNLTGGNNFITSANEGFNDHQWLVKWDHNFGSKHIFSTRYIQMVQALTGINNDLFGPGDNFPSVNTDWAWIGRSAVVKLTSTISQRLVNDFEFGYSRNHLDHMTGASSDKTLASRTGFTYTELFPETSGSFPTLSGLDVFGTLNNRTPFANHSDNFQLKDDIAYVWGRHNLKVGGTIRWNRKTEPANGGDNETAGTFSFASYAQFLAGTFSSYTEEQTQNPVGDRSKDVGIYVQDTWKVRSNLTLDLGLRWQYLSPTTAVGKNIANFRPSAYNSAGCSIAAFDGMTGFVDPTVCNTLNGVVTPRMPGISGSTLNSHYKDWEPRVGIAWQPDYLKRMVVRTGLGIYHGRDAISQTSALGRQAPFDILPVINGGTFASLAAFNSNLPQPPGALSALDQNYLNPSSYQYSFGLQYELMKETALEINYVGSHQIHLGRNRNINQVSPAAQIDIATNGGATLPVPGIVDSARRFLGFDLINANERAGTSRYDALQVFFSRRMRAGLLLQAAYTFSKNIGTTPNQDTEAKFQPVQNAFNVKSEKGLVNQDTPQSLIVNFIYELPLYRNSTGWVHETLGGWQVAGIATFRSGTPLNVCINNTGVDVAGTGTGTASYECQRPDIVGDPNLPRGQRTTLRYFNTDAFVLPAPGTFGNAPRNEIRGPGINNWDLSIYKSFSIPWFGRKALAGGAEGAKLEFRTDFFNAWNHAQFNSFSGGAAQLDLNFQPDPSMLPGSKNVSGSFGSISTARAPREIQFSLRFVF